MKIYLKHISACLLIVFSFPIVYQAIHIHIAHSAELSHSCCHHSENKTNHLAYTSEEESSDSCPVCNYEIASFNLSKRVSFLSSNLLIAGINYFDYQKVYIAFTITSSAPRAPPVI